MMAFMVLLPGLAALLSWNLGLKLLSPPNGLLFINFVPITTFVIMAFHGYQISNYEFFGTLLIIFAIIRNNMHQRKTIHEKDHSVYTATHDPKGEIMNVTS